MSPPHLSSVARMLACAVPAVFGTVAHSAAQQQAQVMVQIGGPAVVQAATAGATDDPGTPVEMFENPNLDRYLRRAQEFLGRSDYTAAIEVLQDVVEGRTVEVVALRPDEAEAAADPAASPTMVPPPTGQPGHVDGNESKDGGRSLTELDARNSVFSRDGRLYRPVRRLCHELLADLPEVGLELYRTSYEVAAEELLAEALASGSTAALEEVANRYFVTLPAGKALSALADRWMHAGRYRSAVQVLRDLVELYPEANRKQLGIDEAWCRFKIAVCLGLAGERSAARQALVALAQSHPEKSLRVQGQLETIASLPDSELFGRDLAAVADVSSAPAEASGSVVDPAAELVAMWQYRFRDPAPYREPTPSRERSRRVIFSSGGRSTSMPHAARYGPATWVAFDTEFVGASREPRALFQEHFRLQMADAGTGLLLHAGEGEAEVGEPGENHPRIRIAAVDHALLRPVEDERHRYEMRGYGGASVSNSKVLSTTELVAYARTDWQQAWSTEQWLDGDDGLRGVTFLAAPTVFGEQLMLPALRAGSYTLECLDRNTGQPLWHRMLHAGGSVFFKAPGAPVVVQSGIAYVLTNAGCVAAVDAFAGDVRWIRRYERIDTIHKTAPSSRKATTRNNNVFGRSHQFMQSALESFVPSDLLVYEGTLIVAPCDGEVLLSIDMATGELVWMLDGNTRFAPYGDLRQIVGADGEVLYALSDSHLVCIELRGGLVRWQRRLPDPATSSKHGRGRGCVVDGQVLLPDGRDLIVVDVRSPSQPVRRVSLPDFDQSREPLSGSCNLVVHGPWLAVGYSGGVELYSTAAALRGLAADVEPPIRRAFYLERAGDSAAAQQVLSEAVRTGGDEDVKRAAAKRLVRLVAERASDYAQAGDLQAALAAMDEVRELLDRGARLDWHVARLDLCRLAGDMTSYGIEQERLYSYMEGRG